MKKNLVFIISAIMAMGIFFNSCESAPSTKVELKTGIDSISYSLGASIAENVEGSLHQAGVIVDTFAVAMEYSSKIDAEQDEAKKASLTKEKKQKIDSIKRANDYAVVEFLRGFEEGVNARASKNNFNLGLSFGSQIAQQAIPNVSAQFIEEGSNEEVNKKALIAAVSATVQKKGSVFPNASTYIMMKAQEMQQKAMGIQTKSGDENKAEGEAFLEANKSKEGVVALPSGVQYKILTEGKGPKPQATDAVVCHYHGELLDGTVFDSSVERGQPASFPVMGVIPGWIEVLQLMPVGSKWEVYIPYDKAYGEQGTGREIGPYATLKFQIELLEIAKN